IEWLNELKPREIAGWTENVPLPLPRRIVTVQLPVVLLSATARSRLPSASKSAATRNIGAVEKGMLAVCVNGPLPLARKTMTVLLLEFATATSGFPSRSKSPRTTERGPAPPLIFTALVKVTGCAELTAGREVNRKMSPAILKKRWYIEKRGDHT